MDTVGLSPFILGSVPTPTIPSDGSATENDIWLYSRWQDFESAAVSTLLNSVSKAQISLLTQCTTSSEMWFRLKDSYMLNSDVAIARLESELVNLTWKRNTKLEDYISEIDHIADQLRACGHPVPDYRLRMTLLRGLPERLNNIQHILLNQSNLSYAATCDNLRAHVSLAHSQDSGKERALTVSSGKETGKPVKSGRFEKSLKFELTCSTCNKSGHTSEVCFKNLTPAQLADVKKKWVCRLCSKMGHFPKDCELSANQSKPEVSTFPDESDEPIAAVTMMASASELSSKSQWIVDSGCTHHMCNSTALFSSGSESKVLTSKQIHLADDTTLKIKDTGSVELRLNVNESRPLPVILKNALLVPDLSKNLFSVTACMKQGIDVLFDYPDNKCYLKRNGETVGIAHLQNGLWVLQTHPTEILSTPKANVAIHAISAALKDTKPEVWREESKAETYLAVATAQAMAPVSVNDLDYSPTRRLSIRQPVRRGQNSVRVNTAKWTKVKNRFKNDLSRNSIRDGNSSTYDSDNWTLKNGPIKLKKKNECMDNMNSFSVLEALGDDVE